MYCWEIENRKENIHSYPLKRFKVEKKLLEGEKFTLLFLDNKFINSFPYTIMLFFLLVFIVKRVTEIISIRLQLMKQV